MSNETEQQQVWSRDRWDAEIAKISHPVWKDGRLVDYVLLIDADLLFRLVQSDYEADRAALQARIDELEAERDQLAQEVEGLKTELEAAQEWQPVPDGMYEYPNWNGKGTLIIRILNDGAELEQWHNSLPDDIEEISLSSDYRLYQRKDKGDA